MAIIAVTGSSGLLGVAVVRELKEQGYTVWGYDSTGDAGETDRFVRGDILDQPSVTQWMTGSEGLIHLAAIPAPGLASSDWITMVNVMGTYRVLDSAAAAGIKTVVLASSVSVLGLAWGRRYLPDYLPIDEQHPLYPEDAYSVSKYLNEIHAAMFAKHYAMPIAMVRLPTILTDRTRAAFQESLRSQPELAARLLWTYVDAVDAARACRLALEHPCEGARPYYIAAEHHLAGDHLESLLTQYFPGVQRTEAFDPHGSLISYRAAAEAWGYHPSPDRG